MEFLIISSLNGLSYGLLLFMLSSGLTLIFSMMGVLNFAHASFYMLGAYFGYSISKALGFWPALVLAPLLVGFLGALFERFCLRRAHKFGHLPELLITFGLTYVVLEVVQLVWGRIAVNPRLPPLLQGPAFTLIDHSTEGLSVHWGAVSSDVCVSTNVAVQIVCSPFPATRGFMMLVAISMLLALWALLTRTRVGLVIQAALTHPEMVETLGHNVPRIFMLVFGVGAALAGLAGVIGGITFLTEPAMAATVGAIVFVVVMVGGLGSLAGAFFASLLIGMVQTFAVSLDYSLGSFFSALGVTVSPAWQATTLLRLSIAQAAPTLPYVFLILMLIVRPRGLLGHREG
jgi:branched-chain amino acid transport system permease protein